MSLDDLEKKTTSLLRHRGDDEIINEIIDNIQSNLSLGIEQATSDPNILPMMIAAIYRLDEIFENWIKHQDEPEYVRVKEAVLHISDSIIASLPDDVRVLIALGDHNGIIPLRGLNNLFIIECLYLQSHSFQEISPLGHEIGHIFFDLYARDDERRNHLVTNLVRVLMEISEEMDKEIISKSATFFVSHWLNEFTADAISLLYLGPEVVIRDFEEIKKQGRPILLGSDSHPPPALRIRFMRDRCLKVVGQNPGMSSFIHGLRKLKTPTSYFIADNAFIQKAIKNPKYNKDVLENMPRSTISSDFAFHKQTISTLSRLVDDILSWGNVESKLEEIKNAYTIIMQEGKPECDSATLYGAYLSAVKNKPEINFLDLVSRTT